MTIGLLFIIGCDNAERTAFISKHDLVVVGAPAPLECKPVAKFGSVRIFQSLVRGELRDWGEIGWEADASIGPNITIRCTDPLRYKEVSVDAWRSSITKLLKQTAVDDDLRYLLPPKLGDHRIWIGQTPTIFGLYFVNTRNMGVVTIVSRDQQVGVQLLISGAGTAKHGNVLTAALSGVQFADEDGSQSDEQRCQESITGPQDASDER